MLATIWGGRWLQAGWHQRAPGPKTLCPCRCDAPLPRRGLPLHAARLAAETAMQHAMAVNHHYLAANIMNVVQNHLQGCPEEALSIASSSLATVTSQHFLMRMRLDDIGASAGSILLTTFMRQQLQDTGVLAADVVQVTAEACVDAVDASVKHIAQQVRARRRA